MKRKLLTLAALGLVALAAVLIPARPDPGHDMFTAYRDPYPGTPASAEAACRRGRPALRRPDAAHVVADVAAVAVQPRPSNLPIAHVFHEYAGHVVSVAP